MSFVKTLCTQPNLTDCVNFKNNPGSVYTLPSFTMNKNQYLFKYIRWRSLQFLNGLSFVPGAEWFKTIKNLTSVKKPEYQKFANVLLLAVTGGVG